jgi:acetyltransferase-like isoleucine patch superfamily enzyme
MDIEGGEYDWILSLNTSQLNKFKQIVIEFHGINDDTWNNKYNNKIECLKKLSTTHYLIHAHGNNCSFTINGIPDVIELTYINKSLFNCIPNFNTTPLPIQNLDSNNHFLIKEDIDLNFYPFVQNIKKYIGKYTYGNTNVNFENDNAKLVIGNFCSIGEKCNIYLCGNHRTDRVTTYPFGHINQNIFNNFNGEGHPSTKGDVIIGNDVWIGSNVTIMSGVTIGDGVVIANNSHVVENIKPYSLIGGNPAKIIRYRFREDQIENLLKIKWWFWDDEQINKSLSLLCNDNIDDFIKSALKPI